HQQYGQSLAGTVAYDYSVTVYSGEREFDEALARSEEVIGTYESQDSDDEAAWALFEQALIYEGMSGSGLGRITSESDLAARADQCYEQILNDYSSTEAAYFLRELLGEEHPPDVVSVPVPERFSLNSAYPNPFNPSTTIRYELPQDAHVTMKIYDILGKEVRRLVDSEQAAGFRSVLWDGKDGMGNSVASGVYIYRIEVGKIVSSKKLLLLR
ncbi:MAG: FlgD immunoglobulin-like domain containing protein, partial [Fidelibacterota bacterium]